MFSFERGLVLLLPLVQKLLYNLFFPGKVLIRNALSTRTGNQLPVYIWRNPSMHLGNWSQCCLPGYHPWNTLWQVNVPNNNTMWEAPEITRLSLCIPYNFPSHRLSTLLQNLPCKRITTSAKLTVQMELRIGEDSSVQCSFALSASNSFLFDRHT